MTTNKNSKARLWTGRIISIICILFLIFDGVAKIIKEAHVMEANQKLGYPDGSIPLIGFMILICTALYAIPRTSILGAVLLTAHLGGATATLVRAGDPFFFPIIFGVLIWVGIYLRDDRLRELIPLSGKAED